MINSQLELGHLNLDNVYDYNVSLFIITITKYDYILHLIMKFEGFLSEYIGSMFLDYNEFG